MSKVLGLVTLGVFMAACDPASDEEVILEEKEAVLEEKRAVLEEAGITIEESEFRSADPCSEAVDDAYAGYNRSPSGSEEEMQYLELLFALCDFCPC